MASAFMSQELTEDRSYYARGRETFIRLSLLALMGVSCALLMRPFLKLILCGIIIAIGIYPAHRLLTKVMGGRAKLSAALCTGVLLVGVILPCVLMAGTLVQGVQTVTRQLQAGRLNLPPPPPSLDKLPIAGAPLHEFWNLCSTNITEAVKRFSPQIQARIPALLSMSAGVGGIIVQFLIAIVLGGYLLATSEANGRLAERVFLRIFGDQGPDFKDLVASTIRTVTNGILGVAVVQTLFASLGFWVVGLPGAGLWALLFLVASVLQVGTLVLVPAAIYAFAAYSTGKAAIFLVWCIVVGLMDNVLKPILLGRGGKVPMAVIFLGVLGGFMVMNSILGLFVGAIVLSVGYKLFIAWLNAGVPDGSLHDDLSEAH